MSGRFRRSLHQSLLFQRDLLRVEQAALHVVAGLRDDGAVFAERRCCDDLGSRRTSGSFLACCACCHHLNLGQRATAVPERIIPLWMLASISNPCLVDD
jgi:hypothetical protein